MKALNYTITFDKIEIHESSTVAMFSNDNETRLFLMVDNNLLVVDIENKHKNPMLLT